MGLSSFVTVLMFNNDIVNSEGKESNERAKKATGVSALGREGMPRRALWEI